jgi:hypothetical protein
LQLALIPAIFLGVIEIYILAAASYQPVLRLAKQGGMLQTTKLSRTAAERRAAAVSFDMLLMRTCHCGIEAGGVGFCVEEEGG